MAAIVKRANRPWRSHESNELMIMWGKLRMEKIAERLGRTVKSIEARHAAIVLEREGRQAMRHEWWSVRRPADDRDDHFRRGPPDKAAIAEMWRRRDLERASLTAKLCGDPLPGYSALDRQSVC